jgi:hypothetical protein
METNLLPVFLAKLVDILDVLTHSLRTLKTTISLVGVPVATAL